MIFSVTRNYFECKNFYSFIYKISIKVGRSIFLFVKENFTMEKYIHKREIFFWKKFHRGKIFHLPEMS